MHIYLEGLFVVWRRASDAWGEGDFSVRLETKNRWFGRVLSVEFNDVAAGLQKTSAQMREYIQGSLSEAENNSSHMIEELKQLSGKFQELHLTSPPIIGGRAFHAKSVLTEAPFHKRCAWIS